MLEILKWLGTACVIIAAACRSFDLHAADMFFSIVGALVWAYAAVKMKDKPLMVVNGFITAILLYGVVK
jgi:hypothetical protein